MIIAIRERLFKNRNTLSYIIFAVLGLAFLMPSFVRKISLYGDWMIRVNGQDVSYHDYVRKASFFEQQITYIRQQYGQYADIFLRSLGLASDPKELAFKSLIDDELLNQSARKLGVQFDTAYVTEQLGNIQFVQQVMPDLLPLYVYDPSGEINEERFGAYLKRTRLSASSFDDKVREALSRIMLLRLLASGIEVPSFESLERFVKNNQARKYSLIELPLDRLIQKEKEQPVSEKDLQDFYMRRKETYRIPEKRGGTIWSLAPELYGITVSDDDLQAYYETHKTQQYIETPAQIEVRHIVFDEHESARAASIVQELRNDPAQFAAKAQEFSIDKDSGSQGGLVKPFAKGTHPDKVFERTAFLLPHDGAISDVIKTDAGFEILQRVGKTPAIFKPLEKVKKEIKDHLIRQKFAQAFLEDTEALMRTRDGRGMEDFVENKGGHAKDHQAQEAGSSKISKALFSLEKPGAFTAYVDGGKGIVVRLTTLEPSSMPDLSSIQDDVLADLYKVRAQERSKKLLLEARNAAVNSAVHESLEDIARSIGANFLQPADFISPSEINDKKWREKKFPLPLKAMLALEKAGLLLIHETERIGYLIRCDAVAPLDMQEFLSKKDELHKELEHERLTTGTHAFVASLYRDATIEINKQTADE